MGNPHWLAVLIHRESKVKSVTGVDISWLPSTSHLVLAVLSAPLQLLPVIVQLLQTHDAVLQTRPTDTRTRLLLGNGYFLSNRNTVNSSAVTPTRKPTKDPDVLPCGGVDVAVPVKAVHHFQVHPQVLLGEVVQHAGVHQTLHEVGAVLRKAQAREPLVSDPLVVHVAVRQSLNDHSSRTLLFFVFFTYFKALWLTGLFLDVPTV